VSTTQKPPTELPARREITTKPRFSDRVFRVVVTTGGLSSLIILGLILAFLTYRGFGVVRTEGFGLITSSKWDVVEDEFGNVVSQDYGLAAMLVGTILCAIIAVLV
jgi:phosphate transport system permease protein